MAKLRGKAKAAFLAKMAAGRRKAARKRKPKRRRNPQLMTVGNPQRRLETALARYRQFHGTEPTKMTKLGGSGPALIALGELREIVYQPRRGQRRGPAFLHEFKAGSVLAVTADGRKLVIVDRKRRKAVDFDRGIVN